MDCTVCFRLRDEHHLYSKHSSSALHVLAVVRQQHNMKHVFEPASQAYYDLSTFPLQKFTDSAPKIKPIGIYYFFLWKRSAIQSEPRNVEPNRNVEIRTKRILLYIRFCAEARMPHSGTEAICGTETKSSIQTTSGTQSKCEIETKSQSKRNPEP